ncbi:MAG: nucleotidyl transferase AbiEii/AbiGii toxin family protein, partial [Rhizobiales bacterium]|nr:nucleotidyl transferase AbiEii/AbiGii toxin family protein [Hyphomicrobiales bacterium]
MKSVLKQVQDTDYILKGGTALLLTRDLDRHSTDLDFDASRKVDLEKRIINGFKEADVELIRIKTVKDTDTVQRFKAHYLNPENGKDTLLKVETSFRNPPDKEMLETVNNIKTYKVEHIFDQKLVAAEDRTKPRDLYDLAHLVEKHGDKLSDEQIMKIDSFSNDMEKLEQKYNISFEDDSVLNNKTVEDTILRMREVIEIQLEDRSLTLSDGSQNINILKNINFSELNTKDTKMDEETWDNMSDQEREEYEADNYLRNQAENELADNPEQLDSNVARMEAEGIAKVEEQTDEINILIEQYKVGMLEL